MYIMDTSVTEFNDAVDKIAGRPEYKNLTNSISDIIDRAKEAITQWLFNILEKAMSKAGALSISKGASIVIIVIGIMAILALLVFIGVRISKTFERRRKVTEILGEKIDEATTPDTLRNKAMNAVLKGDIRQAVRYDFIALLLLMHERSYIYLDETNTNEEIFHFLKLSKFEFLSNFRYCIDNFNFLWYGHRESSKSYYENWTKNFNLLWNEVMSNENKSK